MSGENPFKGLKLKPAQDKKLAYKILDKDTSDINLEIVIFKK